MFSKEVMTQARTLPTLDIVRHNTAVGFEHKLKQFQIMGEPVPSSDIVARMAQSGFTRIVDGKIVGEFKYHASLRGEHFQNVRTQDGKGIAYQGDVPDAILNNIQKAIDCGVKYVTIHSNQPLPVSYTMTDPVALGWTQPPKVNSNFPLKNIDSEGNHRRHFAFVLGVWDEYEIIDICLNHLL